MSLPPSPGLRLSSDLSPAEWIVQSVVPWDAGGARLESFLPARFEAYARILHDLQDGTRWSDHATNPIGPETSFREATGREPQGSDAEPVYALSARAVAALRRVLVSATETPDRCWFCIWVGYGFWQPGSSAILVAKREPIAGNHRRRSIRRRTKRVRRPDPAVPPEVNRVRLPHREYYLFGGRLMEPTFEFGIWHQSPNIWWPDDRAWCVATELDGYSSYVGGSRACIDSVLASPDVETIGVDPTVRMDPGPFR